MQNPVPAPIPPLRLSGLVLAGSIGSTPVLASDVGLEAAPEGIAVLDRSGATVRRWPWTSVGGYRADGIATGPDGALRQVLELDVDGGTHRFLVPAEELAALMGVLASATDPPPSTTPLSAADAEAPGEAGSPLRRARRPRGRHARPGGRPARAAAALLRSRIGRFSVRDASNRLRATSMATGLVVVALATGGGAVSLSHGASGAPATSGTSGMRGFVQEIHRLHPGPLDLPPATTPPEPAPPSLTTGPVLASHEIFAFAPYWSLAESGSFDVTDLSTIAYFSLDVNANATIDESGPGWVGYQSQALADLVTRAHQAGDRVVLTVTCFDDGSLQQLTSSPTAGTQLGTEVAQLLAAKNLDGVNVDFEGEGSGDRLGLDRLMAQLSATIRGTDPHWQITMDTYASAAAGDSGFYDIAGLAPSVDSFFVMAYDMENPDVPSANAALLSNPDGYTDLTAIEQYTSVVPASKVVLGVPYYGYDWPTVGPNLGQPATGPPSPVSYAQIAASGHPVYWDPTTQTAWTSYRVGSQWHQTWFDDPQSLVGKADLAAMFHLRGVGIWALGMDGDDPAMLAALLGSAPAAKSPPTGPPPSTSTTTTRPGTTTTTRGTSTSTTVSTTSPTTTTTAPGSPVPYTYQGTWQGSAVDLTLLEPTLPSSALGAPVGSLTGLITNDPSFICLESAGSLSVSPLASDPAILVVSASTPTDCTTGTWAIGANVVLPTTTTTSTTTTVQAQTPTTSPGPATDPTDVPTTTGPS